MTEILDGRGAEVTLRAVRGADLPIVVDVDEWSNDHQVRFRVNGVVVPTPVIAHTAIDPEPPVYLSAEVRALDEAAAALSAEEQEQLRDILAARLAPPGASVKIQLDSVTTAGMRPANQYSLAIIDPDAAVYPYIRGALYVDEQEV